MVEGETWHPESRPSSSANPTETQSQTPSLALRVATCNAEEYQNLPNGVHVSVRQNQVCPRTL